MIVYKIYNLITGKYVCDENMQHITFYTLSQIDAFIEVNNLNRNVFKTVAFNKKKGD